MKNIKFYLFTILLISLVGTLIPSCKKGDDDPAISLISRKDRFTNTWTLSMYEKNGTSQDISGTTYTYLVRNDGTLTQTVEGTIFGQTTRTVTDGTWLFLNDDEDVKITIGNDVTIYNIQRLAAHELWLRKTTSTDTYTYYFTGL